MKAFIRPRILISVACVLFVRDWKGSASRLTLSNQGQTSARADFLCVLHAAVAEWLAQRGHAYHTGKDNNGQAGALLVVSRR